jgi:hypothetical protein
MATHVADWLPLRVTVVTLLPMRTAVPSVVL